MSDSISIKVTKIGKLWHARLLENKRVIDESACTRKDDIGWDLSKHAKMVFQTWGRE